MAIVGATLLLAAACGSDENDEAASESVSEPSAGIDVDRFFDGALAEEVVMADCTLSDGTETDCYQITVFGYPSDTEIGPFCPTTTSDTADEVGIWLDGSDVYDIDGQFILDLPEIYGDDNWQLHDDDGNVNVTDTQEAFEGAARPDVDPEYQNHCVEGRLEWLDGGDPVPSSVEIPATATHRPLHTPWMATQSTVHSTMTRPLLPDLMHAMATRPRPAATTITPISRR